MAGLTTTLELDPATVSTTYDSCFSLDLMVDTHGGWVDFVRSDLGFDPSILQAIPSAADCVDPPPATTTLAPDTANLPAVLTNTADNSTGAVHYAAGRSPLTLAVSGRFRVATLRFKVTGHVGTNVTYAGSSQALYAGGSVLAGTPGASITVDRWLVGQVQLQGRGAAPTPAWAGYPLTLDFQPAVAAASLAIVPLTASTDASGWFTVSVTALSQVSPYNVSVHGPASLTNVRQNVVLSETYHYEDFGVLVEGDVDGHDDVDGADYSLLVQAYDACTGDPAYLATADFNGDGCVGAADYSLLVSNYGQSGPIDVPVVAQSSAESAQVDLRVQPVSVAAPDGGIVTLGVWALDTGLIDSADVQLAFDPAVLHVVDANGAAANTVAPGSVLSVVLKNQVDNSAGRIRLAAGRAPWQPAPSGDVLLATVRVQPLSTSGAVTSLQVLGTSGVYHLGEALPGGRYGAIIFSGSGRVQGGLWLPVMLR